MEAFYSDDFGTLYLGKAEEILPELEPDSVDMVVTSPPYWQARKYIDENELGQEPDYKLYIDHLCEILYLCRDPLKSTGSLFINLGDKYFSKTVGTGGKTKKQLTNSGSFFDQNKKIISSVPEGTLMNIPNRFAIEFQDDYGFILKHTIIWHKPNAFPTSNKKKFTFDFEYLFHFILDPKKYYFRQQFEPFVENTDVIYRKKIRANKEYNSKEPYRKNTPYKHNTVRVTSQESPNRMWEDTESLERQLDNGRNKRSVWSITIGNSRSSTSHIAMYPIELCMTPIKACSPEKFGVVLDPFIGSGTTAIAAEILNRKWIGIEAKEEYCEEAIKRILKEREKRNGE